MSSHDWDEAPVWLEAADGPVLAVVTRPRMTAPSRTVVLCPGGWHGTSTNRNRLLVHLARRLASTGSTVLRFDWHGVGESHGELTRYDLGTPFVDDVRAGVDHLVQCGHDRVALVGVCFGAHTALAVTPDLRDHLERVALISFPVPDRVPRRAAEASTVDMLRLAARPSVLQTIGDRSARQLYQRKLRSRWRRARGQAPGPSGGMQLHQFDPGEVGSRLGDLVDAGIPTLLLFGETDPYYVALAAHRDEILDPLVERSGGLLRIETCAVELQGFGTVAAQQAAIDGAVTWLGDATPVRSG